MNQIIISYCLPVILLISIIDAYNISNDGEMRQPRGSGRFVKLYSGVRPDPIVCTDEGFKGDPNDCAVFYRCTKSGRGKYISYGFRCPPGTVYDPDTEVCNHPQNTKRSECGGIKQVTSPHYEVNVINEVQEVPSPISTVVPVYTPLTTVKVSLAPAHPTISQKPTTIKWQSSTSTTIRPISTGPKEITAYPWISTSANNLQVTSSSFPNSQQNTHEDICTTDGFMGDSVNCHKFYRCVGNQRSGFTKFEFSCSEPTIWDDDIQSCNHPWAVKRSRCGRSNTQNHNMHGSIGSNTILGASTANVNAMVNSTVSSPKESDKTIQNQLQISYGTKVHQSQTQISNNPIIQNQTQINYGDRLNKSDKDNNKQNQNQISYGAAVSQSQTQISYGNEVVQTQVQIDHSKQSSQSQVQITESTTPTTKSTKTQGQKVTENKPNVNNTCSQSGFMADSNDCKKFYRCVDNGRGGFIRHDFSCGEGTLWDQSIESCNHAWAVKECGSMSSRPISQETTTILSPLSTTYTYSTTTNKSIEIYSSSTTEVTQPEDFDDTGYNNNHVTSSSVSVTKPTTEIIHHVDTECVSSGFVGDAKDCQIFYSCVENGKGGYTKYTFKCNEGTLWDADIGACNHAWAVKRCGGNVQSTSIETTSIKPTTTTSKLTTSLYTTSSESYLTTKYNDFDTGYGIHNEPSSPSTTKSTVPPRDQNVGNECQSNGFMGDNNDCKKFYRCVDNGNGTYIRYEFTCGDGTAWDSKIEGCNHAWAVNCKDNGISISTTSTTEATTQKKPVIIDEENEGGYNMPESDNDISLSTQKSTSTMKITVSDINSSTCKKSGFIGDTSDCKRFYRCVDKGDGSFIRYEFTCSEGTVWDQKIEACNHAGAVERCGGYYEDDHGIATTSAYNVTMSEEKPVHGYPTPGYPENEDGYSKTTQTTTTITSTPITSSYCKKDGFIGDESDCKIFYRCVNDGKGGFIKYEYKCGEGTVWDQSIEACNHAWAVKECGVRNETIHDINDSTSETMPITSSEHVSSSTEKATTTTDSAYDNAISDNCEKEGFINDKKDCKKFYRCVNNGHGGYNKYEFTCGEGTYWNQIIQACDHASSENPCKGHGNSIVTKEPQHVNDEQETTTKLTVTLTSTSLGVTPDSSTKTPQSIGVVCRSEGFFGDLRDCQKFYRCVNDGKGGYNKYEFTCGEGTIWDQEQTTCVHKAESNNCSSSFTEDSSQPDKSQENDNLYTTTSTKQPHQTSTQKENTSQQTSTENILPGSYECMSEGFHANPQDCRKFIRCVDNGKGTFTKYDFSCGEGTVWVQKLLACDHDDGSSFCHAQSEWTTKSQIITEITTQPNTASSATTTHIQTTNKNDDNYHTENTKAPQIINEDCQSEGFYADKDDCKKYYRCVPNNGGYTKNEFICGDKTAWDTNLQTCNHDSFVNRCQGSYQPNNQTEPVIHDEISETAESSTTSTTQSSTTESKDTENGASKDTCKNEGFFGNTKFCNKFYRCVDNGEGGFTKYDFNCGEGTLWDQDLLTCNHPHDVVNPSCTEGHGETTESTTTTSGTTSTSTSVTQNTQSTTTASSSSTTTTLASGSTASSTESSTNCTQEETSKKPGNKNVTCDKAGYYPDPSDCKKFYRCVDWDGKGEKFSVYFFECGEGTIWDPALDTCNHEESVYPPRDCSNQQPQNTTESTTITNENTTTQQSTTNEPTTTQQSTTSEQTTTQQSTTSEQTTTQQSTTSEQTTTQQSTTSEQTTAQPSTTSEQTTTQQATTSAQTTTQQSTTSEQTTTQQSTTSEQTTTQQSTTGEQTTTQQSTTSEQTTTQQSTTSEQTTTQQYTTEESTTIGSTIQQSTTESEGTTESTNSSTTTDSTTTLTTDESTTGSTTTESSVQTTTTENQTETTTVNNSNSSSCPDTDDGQYLFVCPTSFRRHPKYCNLFYQCTEDDDSHEVKVAVFNCPNNTIYDESKIQCVEEYKAEKKCDGEIASRRRVKRLGANYKEPIVVTKDSQKCSTIGHMPFEKNSECSPAFLKCEKSRSGTLRGFVHRCPQNYLYWSISRRCEREEVIRDCKRTINNWSGRWEIPIDRHNVAW
ncbi:serine-rich adhesin for platelets [Manduca sexta]|uniref:serine-rich adhesin for platelets n=1 Tax=Manduca sexta TaxID=7130 RepID=UPI00188F8690|nr:serine-rich adhesin for platelets [Manduca sexta]